MRRFAIKYSLNVLCLFVALSVIQSSTAQILIPIAFNPESTERQWLVNDILDSVINKIPLNKGGIICVTDKFVSIDTITLNKVKRTEADSVVLGKFLKKNQKKISSKEFWGLLISRGDGRRYYNGKMYTVWESPTPYIYRTETYWRRTYYFSENLLSPLALLNGQSIDSAFTYAPTRDILNRAMEDNARTEQIRAEARKDAVVEVSVDILNVLFRIMLIAMDSGLGSNSHSKSDHSAKTQTGRRK